MVVTKWLLLVASIAVFVWVIYSWGYSDGCEDGYYDGHEDGYSDGYNDGYYDNAFEEVKNHANDER